MWMVGWLVGWMAYGKATDSTRRWGIITDGVHEYTLVANVLPGWMDGLIGSCSDT